MSARAKLLWPTVAMSGALAVLISLGTWQLERKAWKDALQATIEANAKARPIAIEEAAAAFERDAGHAEYLAVGVAGRWRHEATRLLYAPDPKLGPGHHAFTPLELRSGRVIWVNRGFVPERLRADILSARTPAGEVAIEGLLRAPGTKGLFTPQNDAQRNAWYWRDIAVMHATAFPSAPPATLPFHLDALAPVGAAADGYPRPGTTLLKLTNRHLEYALTWYGLAATLVGVFAAFAWGRLHAAPREATRRAT